MKKLVLAVALLFSVSYLMAQDETVIQLMVSQKQYEKAKDQVDKWLAQPKLKDKEKPNAYLWKMLVYSNLATDSALSGKYPDAVAQSMDAFYQYQQLDPSLKALKEGNFQAGIGNLYTNAFQKGKSFYDAKQWDSSFKYFSESQRLGSFLLTNKLSTSTATIDTLTVLYSGITAQNAQKLDSAAKYYAMIADIKASDKEYEDIYKFLIGYYSQNKDNANFTKYLALAKELYPGESSLWTQYEMENMTTNTSLTSLMQKYQDEATAGGLTEDKIIGYAQAFESNDSTQLKDLDSTQKVQLKLAAGQAYAKAFDLNNTNGTYAFGAGYYYYYAYEILDDRYHTYSGESASLKTKRAQIAKEQMMYADSATIWLEKAFTILSTKQNRERNETANLNRAVNFLSQIYGWKRDRTKIDGNNADYDKYDALYKKYDELYNTFK